MQHTLAHSHAHKVFYLCVCVCEKFLLHDCTKFLFVVVVFLACNFAAVTIYKYVFIFFSSLRRTLNKYSCQLCLFQFFFRRVCCFISLLFGMRCALVSQLLFSFFSCLLFHHHYFTSNQKILSLAQYTYFEVLLKFVKRFTILLLYASILQHLV